MTTPIRVLYVDDSPFDRDLVRDALTISDREFAVREASNRHDFEAALGADQFDCVLSDLNIFGYSGLEALAAVRERDHDLPVVILTGTGSEELAVEAMKRGVSDYILKSPRHIRRLPYTLTAVVENNRVVAERRSAEEAVRQAQADLLHASRLSVLGEVAGTIAHEVNQPIGAAKNYLQVARRAVADPAVQDILNKVDQQLTRAAETLRKVREFAAKHALDFQVEAVRPLIEESCALGLLGAGPLGIRTRLEIPEGLPRVLVDRIQVQQVLVNLIRNAVEAVSEVETRTIRVSVALDPGGDMVEIAVTDTGPGISEEVRSRLFTAYTTTKPNGTGLGLSISRSIAEAHGGKLWAEPRDEGGAVFRLTLPTTRAPGAANRRSIRREET